MYAEFLRYRRFQPAVATTIADGLRLAPAADVIVTGIALPGGGDGLEFIARVRGNELTKSTPLIVLTAKLLTTEQYEAARSACDGFLRKPCLPDALVREVRRVLASGRLRAARAKPVKSASRRNAAAPRRAS
jgi:DNA-binding response OmpR family regulator